MVSAAARSRDRDGKKERLVQAAVALFAEVGYAGASVQQIVERAQVSKGSLYHYFSSKDDVLYAIYEPLLKMQKERLEAIITLPLPIDAKLRRAAEDVIETSAEHIAELTVFFQSMHMLEEGRRTLVRRERRRYHEAFRSLVEAGQAEGVFRTSISADLAVHGFFGSVHHLYTWYKPDGSLESTEIAETLASLFLDGLRQGNRT